VAPETPATPPAIPDPDKIFAGVPDAFGRLWTPHRMAYIKGEGKPSGPGEDEGCPFCRAPTLSDAEGLIEPAREDLIAGGRTRTIRRAEHAHPAGLALRHEKVARRRDTEQPRPEKVVREDIRPKAGRHLGMGAGGRRDEATAVAGLRKPSVAAWAVNQLVRTQRRALDDMLAAGDALRITDGALLRLSDAREAEVLVFDLPGEAD